MNYLATTIGVFGVVMLILSYQQRRRKNILFCNIIARTLFILQYFLLFAFEGAVLDIVAVVGSLPAQWKEKPWIKKHLLPVIIGVNVLILAVGLLMFRNLFSLLPVLAVLLQVNALWCSKEKNVRLLSLAGVPCWLGYNLYTAAYGSVLADVLSVVSLCVALWRYDLKKK